MATKKRPDGRVEIKATVGKTFDGKRMQKSFYGKSRLDAQRKADEYILQQEIANQTGDVFIKKEYTFAEWANKWLVAYKKPNVSDNTYRLTYETNLRLHIIPYFKNAKLTDIKSIDIMNFLAQKQYLSASVLEKLHSILFSVFDAAIDNDLCYKNPVKNIKYVSTAIPNDKKVLTDEQITYALEYFRDNLPEGFLMLATGMRRGEMCGLKWVDIDFEAETLSIKRSISDKKGGGVDENQPKWESYRTLPLVSAAIGTRLVDLLLSLPKNGDYVFANDEGACHSPNSFSQRLKRHAETMHSTNSDFPVITSHELRHTYGTKLCCDGVDIYTIQKLMGHKDIKMTSELYVHNEIDTLKQAVKKTRA